MSVLYRDRRKGLPGSRGFRQSTLLPREYRGQGNNNLSCLALILPLLLFKLIFFSFLEYTAGSVAMRVCDRAGSLGESLTGVSHSCRFRDGNVYMFFF